VHDTHSVSRRNRPRTVLVSVNGVFAVSANENGLRAGAIIPNSSEHVGHSVKDLGERHGIARDNFVATLSNSSFRDAVRPKRT